MIPRYFLTNIHLRLDAIFIIVVRVSYIQNLVAQSTSNTILIATNMALAEFTQVWALSLLTLGERWRQR